MRSPTSRPKPWTRHHLNAAGPNSRALKFHIASACSGYATPPTSAELYDAFHTATPTPRSEMLIRMWMNEASENDFFDAWREGCYSWRDIAQACHRHGVLDAKNAPMIRRFAFPKGFTKGPGLPEPTDRILHNVVVNAEVKANLAAQHLRTGNAILHRQANLSEITRRFKPPTPRHRYPPRTES